MASFDAYHKPVLLDESISFLNLNAGKIAVDATLGGGGHASAIIEKITPGGDFIGIDRDMDAIVTSTERLNTAGARIRLVNGNMGNIGAILSGLGFSKVDAILADLGVSSFQLDEASRGFSFKGKDFLDMRMDAKSAETAAEWIASHSEEEIKNVLWEYGEERFRGRIAREIKGGEKIETTEDLAAAVMRAIPSGFRRTKGIHPATRTFQAIRIAVNNEMGELENFLRDAPQLLSSGGRLVVISYHSLEDRRVKHSFRALDKSGEFRVLSKKVVIPTQEEIDLNARSRSAKLRAIECM